MLLCVGVIICKSQGRTKTEGAENRVLRRTFGPKREEVDGGWRRLHNKELRNSYASPNITRVIKSRSMRWAGHVAGMGELTNAYKILVEKSEGKRPLGRSRHRREDNMRKYLREMG
jgi:hypothetical protein